MVKNVFLRGAAALTVAGIAVKILGGVNRILLSRILGGEGIGLYQIAYPVYMLGLSIAGAGVPIALSVMVIMPVPNGFSRLFLPLRLLWLVYSACCYLSEREV